MSERVDRFDFAKAHELEVTPARVIFVDEGDSHHTYLVIPTGTFDAWMAENHPLWIRRGTRLYHPHLGRPGVDPRELDWPDTGFTGYHASVLGCEGCPGRWFSSGTILQSAGKKHLVLRMSAAMDV